MGSGWLLIESSNWPPQNQDYLVGQNLVLALAWAKALTLLGKGSKWLVDLFSKMFSH